MATYQILYWQHIPTQIKVWDENDELSVQLSPWFMEEVDRVAQAKGLTDADAYLEQWKWSDEEEEEGTAEEVAEAVKNRLHAEFNR